MKKNNFFRFVVLGAVVLSGISFEVRGMQTVALIGAVGTVSTWWYLKDTEAAKALVDTAKTYSENQARLAEEREKSANPLLYAQPLEISESAQGAISANERIAAYEEQQKKAYETYQLRRIEEEKPRTIKQELLWNEKQLIESYGPDKNSNQ
jgi:hypothetical protein